MTSIHKILCCAVVFTSPLFTLCYAEETPSLETEKQATGETHESAGQNMKSGFHDLGEGFKEGASETGHAFEGFGKEVGEGFKEGGKEFKDSYEE